MSEYDNSNNDILEKEEVKVEFGDIIQTFCFKMSMKFPNENMTYTQNINAITRLVILLVIISLFPPKVAIVIDRNCHFGLIYAVHFYHNKRKNNLKIR